jgi:hypothetical protein
VVVVDFVPACGSSFQRWVRKEMSDVALDVGRPRLLVVYVGCWFCWTTRESFEFYLDRLLASSFGRQSVQE